LVFFNCLLSVLYIIGFSVKKYVLQKLSSKNSFPQIDLEYTRKAVVYYLHH
jgi:hypothetical protein